MRLMRGRLRALVSSAIRGGDIKTTKRLFAAALATRAGKPPGLRKAEIQTFVSTTATSGTVFSSDLGARLGDLLLDLLGREIRWPAVDVREKLF